MRRCARSALKGDPYGADAWGVGDTGFRLSSTHRSNAVSLPRFAAAALVTGALLAGGASLAPAASAAPAAPVVKTGTSTTAKTTAKTVTVTTDGHLRSVSTGHLRSVSTGHLR